MRQRGGAGQLTRGAVIAAAYAVLTVLLAPISYGLIQCRVSEALCVLPYFAIEAVPGLFVGCLLANLITGAPVPDVIFGSLATLLAAMGTYSLGRRRSPAARMLAPLPPVVFNGLIVGALLTEVYQLGVSYAVAAGYVALGEAAACYLLGFPLMLTLEKCQSGLFGNKE